MERRVIICQWQCRFCFWDTRSQGIVAKHYIIGRYDMSFARWVCCAETEKRELKFKSESELVMIKFNHAHLMMKIWSSCTCRYTSNNFWHQNINLFFFAFHIVIHPHRWPLVRGIQRSTVDILTIGQYCTSLLFPVLSAWSNVMELIQILTEFFLYHVS